MPELLQHLEAVEAARQEVRQPSFLTKLFAGEPDFSLLLPFPAQEPADRAAGDALLDRLDAFLHEHVDAQAIEQEATIPRAVLDGLAELGVFGMTIPRQYGGLGLSQTNYDRVLTRVARHCNILALLLSVHQSIGVPRPLLLFGSEEQRSRWLPRLAKGAISAFALTEPQIGSDPAHMRTTATLAEDGRAYRIDGEKLWCTNSPIAEIILLTAKVEDRITAFVLEMDTPGVEVVQRCAFMGCRGIENGWLRFHDVRVPAEQVVGGVGRGLRVALTALNYGRVSVAAICLGMAQAAYPPAVAWARERMAFGKPIGEHELNTHKLARMAADLFTMEALVELVAGLVDRGQADFRAEAAVAKLVCSERLWSIVDTAMQIRGGRGYETAASLAARGEAAPPIEQLLRDARLYLIGEGASEILKLFIAREVWDPHLKRAAPFFRALPASEQPLREQGEHAVTAARAAARLGSFYARWYAERLRPDDEIGAAGEHLADADLRRELRSVKRTSRRLARVILQRMARHGLKLEERQGIVARLADIGIDLFTMTAVCSYAAERPEQAALARQVCADARDRIAANFDGLGANHDPATTALGRAVLAGDYASLAGEAGGAKRATVGHA